jgi:putative PIN family toxin of toxin-antitoxin system
VRVVLDTNCVVSGLLWFGAPRRVLELARDGRILLFTSAALLDELAHTLAYPTFAPQMGRMSLDAGQLVREYGSLALMVRPVRMKPIVIADPDDDAVLACALGAEAQAVVTGDRHLLDLRGFGDVPILRPAAFLQLPFLR